MSTRAIWAICLTTIVLGCGFGAVAYESLRSTTKDMQHLLSGQVGKVIRVERLRLASEREGRTARSYLLSGDERFLAEMREAGSEFEEVLSTLQSKSLSEEEAEKLLEVRNVSSGHDEQLQAVLNRQKDGAPVKEVTAAMERDVQPLRDHLDNLLSEVSGYEQHQLSSATELALSSATRRAEVLAEIAVLALAIGLCLVALLLKTLKALHQSRATLEASHDRLAQANRDLDAFAGRIAHDLKNLLAPLSLMPSRLHVANLRHDDAAIEALAGKLERLGRRAGAMLNALLAFSRSGKGAKDVGAKIVNVLREVVEDLEENTAQGEVRLAVDADENLWAACSPQMLHVVLLNVVGNAVKFVASERAREVEVFAREKRGRVEIEVRDSGPGIAPEHLQKVFEPFFRVPNATAQGTGIGLTTVKRIVEGHGGFIRLESKLGEGTLFRIELPLAPGDVEPERPLPGLEH